MHRYPTGAYEYGELSLVAAWDDFTLGTPGEGVVMTIFDVTRMLWLARPEHINDPEVRRGVMHLRSRVKLWGYFMQDHEGPGGRLTRLSREVLMGYDRILMTSPFGVEVVRRTIGDEEATRRGLEWMPHGLWMDVFKPREATTGGVNQVDSYSHREYGVMGDLKSGFRNAKDGGPLPEAPDPLEEVLSRIDKYENVKAAVADLERLRAEGKV